MKNKFFAFALFCSIFMGTASYAEPPTFSGVIQEEVDGTLQAPQTAKVLAELKSGHIEQSLSGRLMGLAGCATMLLIAFALSSNRRKISWRLVGIGLGMQFLFAFIVLKTYAGRAFFDLANSAIVKILSFSSDGAKFLFGNLIGQTVPVSSGGFANVGAMFAFGILPTIIFFSALTAVLYHLRVLEWFVRLMAFAMNKTMGTSGAESFSAAANIFVGQTEAPLLVRPFLEKMTKSEILAVMSGGFATVAGGVMAAYVAVLMHLFPDIAGHLLAASVMSAPASLVMAKIMIPETEISETANASDIRVERQGENLLDAAARGTSDGLMLALNVGAMLIAFIALIAMLNWIMGTVGVWVGVDGLSLEKLFSWLGAPIAWLLGVPWQDAPAIGMLLGTKTAVNEFVAYLQLGDQLQANTITHGKSIVIATYALCGFSNFASIGIQIGGLSALAPSRRSDFAKLALRGMIAGSLACFQTAAIAGILL